MLEGVIKCEYDRKHNVIRPDFGNGPKKWLCLNEAAKLCSELYKALRAARALEEDVDKEYQKLLDEMRE